MAHNNIRRTWDRWPLHAVLVTGLLVASGCGLATKGPEIASEVEVVQTADQPARASAAGPPSVPGPMVPPTVLIPLGPEPTSPPIHSDSLEPSSLGDTSLGTDEETLEASSLTATSPTQPPPPPEPDAAEQVSEATANAARERERVKLEREQAAKDRDETARLVSEAAIQQRVARLCDAIQGVDADLRELPNARSMGDAHQSAERLAANVSAFESDADGIAPAAVSTMATRIRSLSAQILAIDTMDEYQAFGRSDPFSRLAADNIMDTMAVWNRSACVGA